MPFMNVNLSFFATNQTFYRVGKRLMENGLEVFHVMPLPGKAREASTRHSEA